MSLKLLSSILTSQWLIEPKAAMVLLDFYLRTGKGDMKWDYLGALGEEAEERAEKVKFFQIEGVKVAPTRSYGMDDFSFDGARVAVIPVMGPLMKADYCGDLGTASLRKLSLMAANTQSVQSVIWLHDSPGGAVNGTQSFAKTIKEVEARGKRTISVTDGYCCSADYWIGSSAKEFYAGNETDVIGSIGTMCSWYDDSKYLEKEGIILHEFYATASKDKNKMFSEAEKGKPKMLVEEHLDPMNDVFLNAVRENRGKKITDEVLTGKTYTALNAKAAGLIDDVVSFDELVADAAKGGGTMIYFNSNNNSQNTETMSQEIKTIDQLKAAYPDLTTQMVDAAVKTERERCEDWVEVYEADPAAVKAGISAGTVMGKKDMMRLMTKMHSKQDLQNREKDNADAAEADEQQGGGSGAQDDAFWQRVKDSVSI